MAWIDAEPDADIEAMGKDAESHKADDEKRKALVDAKNQADAAIHGAEKGLKDFGDKVSQADRDAIQGAIDDLKATLEVEDAEAIATKTQALIQASMKLGEAMYKAQQEQQGAGGEAEPQAEAQGSDDVVDAEFEEVDGDEKKSA